MGEGLCLWPPVGFRRKIPWRACLLLGQARRLGDFLLSSSIPLRSSTFQRLKAKLLESLCFYPSICSHLAGLGGGAARALAVLSAGRCPLPPLLQRTENESFVLTRTALG